MATAPWTSTDTLRPDTMWPHINGEAQPQQQQKQGNMNNTNNKSNLSQEANIERDQLHAQQQQKQQQQHTRAPIRRTHLRRRRRRHTQHTCGNRATTTWTPTETLRTHSMRPHIERGQNNINSNIIMGTWSTPTTRTTCPNIPTWNGGRHMDNISSNNNKNNTCNNTTTTSTTSRNKEDNT